MKDIVKELSRLLGHIKHSLCPAQIRQLFITDSEIGAHPSLDRIAKNCL